MHRLSDYKIVMIGIIVSQSAKKIKGFVVIVKVRLKFCAFLAYYLSKGLLFYAIYIIIIHIITLARTREM